MATYRPPSASRAEDAGSHHAALHAAAPTDTPADYPRELTMYGSIPHTGRVNLLWSVAAGIFLCFIEWAQPSAVTGYGPVVNIVYCLSLGYWCWTMVGIVWLGEARRQWRRLPDARQRFDRSGVYGLLGWPAVALVALLGVPLACILGVLTARATLDLAGPMALPPEHWPLPLALVLSYSLSLVTFTVDYLRVHLAANQSRAEMAQRQAVEAQLQLLQAQLEPHMLFNTLANLHALIDADPSRAQDMLVRLIAFLRATLSASRRTTHPLHEEFARASDYLTLMQVRMGARLQVEMHLPDSLADVPVPPLLLQPLLENAIQHGLEPSRHGGRLEVTASQTADELILRVLDTGRGLGTQATARRGSAGFGLICVRDRLQSMYGERASLILASPPEGPGTLATLHLPLVPLPRPAEPRAHRPEEEPPGPT